MKSLKNKQDVDSEKSEDVAGHLLRAYEGFVNAKKKLSQTALRLESLLKDMEGTEELFQSEDTEVIDSSSSSQILHQRSVLNKDSEVKEAIQMVKEEVVIKEDDRTFNWSLCDYNSLPPWLRYNDYLLASHRPPLPSFIACLRSIFRMHSETVNIWSHLIGCIAFIVLTICFILRPISLREKIVLFPFLMGAIVCMGFSFAFHTLHCHSKHICMLFSHLDYLGIILLITGTFVPWLYYGFYCSFWLKVAYISMLLTLGLGTSIITVSETFSEPMYQSFRATVFVIFGLSGILPGVHILIQEGWTQFITFGSPLLISSCLYILGAIIYALKVPEKILHGKCDIWFQSHQIFHVLVVFATYINYLGLMAISNYANSTDICSEQFTNRQE